MPEDTRTRQVTVDVHLEGGQEHELKLIRDGLLAEPRRISSRFFYDDRGSHLFESICDLPEYYQTRAEADILCERAREIVAATAAEELVELGSGAATKTRVLLDAMNEAGTLERYIPFDVNESIVRRTAVELTGLYPRLAVHGVIGDFVEHFGNIPEGDHRLFIFLGGTIGNFLPAQALRFLSQIRDAMGESDHFLLGTDLIKNPEVLHAAYNDSRGLTAEFNRNVLRVVNRIADGNFDSVEYEHEAFYNEAEHRIEMWLRSRRDQTVRLNAVDLEFEVARGERILTEISTKFDRELVRTLLGGAGLSLTAFHTDSAERFAISVSRRAF
jgi:L-histidine N-alpha-methyltransferase